MRTRRLTSMGFVVDTHFLLNKRINKVNNIWYKYSI